VPLLPSEFHENMVIWKKGEAWNDFGFLGESKHGKSPLSFAFACMLFLSSSPEIKIFDDCFTLENGRIRQCRNWGSLDTLGQGYYYELAAAMKASGRSIAEVMSGRGSYLLQNVTLYLLMYGDDTVSFRKVRCHRQEFVEYLMATNPFTWAEPKPGKSVVLERFNDAWSYFIIRRTKKRSKELIDSVTQEAITDSKSIA
jgi:hypothetical protein